MENNIITERNLSQKDYINSNLVKIITDYLATQEKFQIILNYRWNKNILETLNTIFLETNKSLFKYSINRNFPKDQYYSYIKKEIKDSDFNQIPIEFLTPDFLFKESNGNISKEAAKLLLDFSKNVLRDKNHSFLKNLKYIPYEVSSIHFDQCPTRFANKHSNLFKNRRMTYDTYWSSLPTIKDKSEYIVLKTHPCMCFITSLFLSFYRDDKPYNCKSIKISFGLSSLEYYYTSDFIPLLITDDKLEISFNTAFLAYFIKIEFFDKNFQQYNHASGDNHYIVLSDLRIRGYSLKKISNRQLLFDAFIDKKNSLYDKTFNYYENLIFLDKEKFMQSLEYKKILDFFDSQFEFLIKTDEEFDFLIGLLFLFKFNKFMKIHPKKNYMLEALESRLNTILFEIQFILTDKQINDLVKMYFNQFPFRSIPIFSSFRKINSIFKLFETGQASYHGTEMDSESNSKMNVLKNLKFNDYFEIDKILN